MEENKENQQPYNSYGQQNDPSTFDAEADAYWYRRQQVLNKYSKKPWSKKKKTWFIVLIVFGVLFYIGMTIANFYFQEKLQDRLMSKIIPNITPMPNSRTGVILPESTQKTLWEEARSTSFQIKAAIDNYKSANESEDLTALDDPRGTLRLGFVKYSSLYSKLGLDYDILALQPNFDPDDYYILFINDGRDGQYKIVCDQRKCTRNGANGNGYDFDVLVYDPQDESMYLETYKPKKNQSKPNYLGE